MPSGTSSDRWIIVSQLVAGVLLVVFGACLEAFAGLSSGDGVAIAVIGVGAALLPAGAAGSASARILQTLPSMAAADLSLVELNPSTVHPGESASGFVFLTAPAPTGGFTVTLTASDASVSVDPASLTLAAGTAGAGFTVATTQQTPTGAVVITAVGGTTDQQVGLQVEQPAGS